MGLEPFKGHDIGHSLEPFKGHDIGHSLEPFKGHDIGHGIIYQHLLRTAWLDYSSTTSGIDLGWAEHKKYCVKARRDPDKCMCEIGGHILYGSWQKDGKNYTPYTGADRPYDFAASFSRDHLSIEVHWSKWVVTGAAILGSGCITLGHDGNGAGYSLPPAYMPCMSCGLSLDVSWHKIDVVACVDGWMRCPNCCVQYGFDPTTGSVEGLESLVTCVDGWRYAYNVLNGVVLTCPKGHYYDLAGDGAGGSNVVRYIGEEGGCLYCTRVRKRYPEHFRHIEGRPV